MDFSRSDMKKSDIVEIYLLLSYRTPNGLTVSLSDGDACQGEAAVGGRGVIL